MYPLKTLRSFTAMMLFFIIQCGNLSAADPAIKETAMPAVGDTAKDFQLATPQGEKVSLSQQLKKGPVVLLVLRGYPGYQCPICTRQVGQYISNAAKLKAANASVMMVYPGAAKDLEKRAEEFIRDQSLPENFYFLVDPDYKFTNAYHLRWDAKRETAYPSTFVIGTDGKIKYAKISKTHGGRANAKEVLQALGE
ncbi:peroxiredoxin family protein [Gimesia sp.]|uniref:peroxiredoxin family protein n=1 Tax=Gimesia sp. TaxID=2024833 RepID=UPI000C64CC91|nr:peroxiredoxin family protein [Gimesia sp.]MAX35260.1 bacteriocin [Gimesia sp.]HAH44287.1 bacteriocin [Planctomycetaceae bacterium]HBL42166.1 bacteriocin [Planctomycetaceae bacterium]